MAKVRSKLTLRGGRVAVEATDAVAIVTDIFTRLGCSAETAQAVARNLNGDLLDETRSAMTNQTLEHSRQKIRDLERKLLTAAAT